MRIGFLGLGAMGFPIACRLAQAGHSLVVHDPAASRSASLRAATAGVSIATGISEVAGAADLIITCLPDEGSVESVYLSGDVSLRGTVHATAITIDHSTCSPDLARHLSAALADRDVIHVEAPLFGGPKHAAEGQLFLALAGREAARPGGQLIASVHRVLESIARGWRWVGEPGTAMAMKVLQNGLGLVQLAAMGEVASACRRLTLDPQLFYTLVNEAGGMAASPLFRERFPRMLTPEPVDGRLAVGAKDARLFRRLIQPAPEFSLAEAAWRAFFEAEAAGLSEQDVTAIWHVFGRSTRMEA